MSKVVVTSKGFVCKIVVFFVIGYVLYEYISSYFDLIDTFLSIVIVIVGFFFFCGLGSYRIEINDSFIIVQNDYFFWINNKYLLDDIVIVRVVDQYYGTVSVRINSDVYAISGRNILYFKCFVETLRGCSVEVDYDY